MAHKVRITLHGVLGERYGRVHGLEIASAAEAVRALSVLHPGFRRDVAEGQWHVVAGSLKHGEAIGPVDLSRPLPRTARALHILPAAAGSGRMGTIVIGAALVAASFWNPLAGTVLIGVQLAGHTMALTAGSFLFTVGAALTLQGVSSLLSPQLKMPKDRRSRSYMFGNAPAIPGEGDPVPLVYGEAIVPGIPVSVGITTIDQSGKNEPMSTARARVLYLIAAGEIEGLVEGGKGITVDRTPLTAPDGSANFEGFTWEFRNGSLDQPPIGGLPGVETEIPVGLEVKHSAPRVRTILNPNVTLVRVTAQIQALYKTGKKGPKGTDLYYDIQTRANGGPWQTVVRKRFDNDKVMSPFETQHEIRRPGPGDWDIRIVKLTDDTDRDEDRKSQLAWSRYTEIVEARLSCPGVAMCLIEYDAKTYGTSLPEVMFHIRGRKTRVPSNYDPVARNCAGVWDGSFKTAWHSNPAWVMYDLLTDRTHGLGDRIGPDLVDKWTLYDIGVHADVPVPDGHGGQEPRYRFDGRLIERTEAYRAVQAVAACWRGTVWWGRGLVTFGIDRPADPVRIVTPANAVDGVISYSAAPVTARHSVARVTWQNPEALDEAEIEPVEDAARMARIGYEAADIALAGCRSRAQARRMGRWLLDTEGGEDELITYKAGLDHADIKPGDIVMTGDRSWAGEAVAGRVLSCTGRIGRTVRLDRPVTIRPGRSYKLFLAMPDGSLAEGAVTGAAGAASAAGTADTLEVASPYPAEPAAGALWLLAASDLQPRLWRVIKVSRDDRNPLLREITAQEHDPTKYARIERDMRFDPPPVSRYAPGRLPPPANLTSHPMMIEQPGAGDRWGLTLAWSPPADARVTRYRAEVRTSDGGPWRMIFEGGALTCDAIDVPRDATVDVRVQSLDALGQTSDWAYLLAVRPASPRSQRPVSPSGVQAIGGVGEIRVTFTPGRERSDFRATEVRVSASDRFDDGWLLAATPDSWVIDTVPPLETRWYWLRTVTHDPGPNGASDWVGPWSAESLQIPSAGWLGQGIVQAINLAGDLQRPIGRVPAIERGYESLRDILAESQVRSNLAQLRGDEAGAAYTRTVERRTVEGLSAEATKREALSARMGHQVAGIVSDQQALADTQQAQAKDIETVAAAAKDNAAAVEAETKARATDKDALAKEVRTVQSTVDGHAASIQTATESMNGLKTRYTVKADQDGVVTGLVQLVADASGDHATSTFAVAANSFVISLLGGQAPVPVFAGGTVGGQPTVTLVNAVIGDLTVTGRCLGVEAATTVRTSNGADVTATGSGVTVVAAAIEWESAGRLVLLSFNIDNLEDVSSRNVRMGIRRIGSDGQTKELLSGPPRLGLTGSLIAIDGQPPAGHVRYEAWVRAEGKAVVDKKNPFKNQVTKPPEVTFRQARLFGIEFKK